MWAGWAWTGVGRVNPKEGLYTKGARAHTHRERIREWLWEPKGRSLEYTRKGRG